MSIIFKLIYVNQLYKRFLSQQINLHTVVQCQARLMSERSRLLAAIQSCFPKLTYDKHKGQAGRIAVIGGSQEYSGAPYFTAISAVKVGADVSHIFCKSEAGVAIKSYSPELIVHPTLDGEDFTTAFSHWLSRMHAVVLGPGLGRDPEFAERFKKILLMLVEADVPVVIDADGLYYLSTCDGLLDVIRCKRHIILTPNVAEMSTLYRSLGMEHRPGQGDTGIDSQHVAALCIKLGHVSVLQKGPADIISDGEHVLVCDVEGSPRRCGGQGDLLAGSLALMAHWGRASMTQGSGSSRGDLLQPYGPNMCAAYGACALTRTCNHLAFAQYGRSTTTTDMVASIHAACKTLFNEH